MKKSKENTYTIAGVVFVIASIIAIATNHVNLLVMWLPIGATFIIIGYTEKKKA